MSANSLEICQRVGDAGFGRCIELVEHCSLNVFPRSPPPVAFAQIHEPKLAVWLEGSWLLWSPPSVIEPVLWSKLHGNLDHDFAKALTKGLAVRYDGDTKVVAVARQRPLPGA